MKKYNYSKPEIIIVDLVNEGVNDIVCASVDFDSENKVTNSDDINNARSRTGIWDE